MSVSQPVPKDDPLMIAWEAWKASESYPNARKWATAFTTECEPNGVKITHPHLDGAFWAAFICGWNARADRGD